MVSVLLAHAARYPLMEPRDAVKLIYQNEFGGGHLIRDEAACLDYLRREYDSVLQKPDLPLLEDIGNNMVRVNLAALDAHHVSPDTLGRAFLDASALHKGNMDSFQEKLAVLKDITRSGKMPFSEEMLILYLTEYQNAGFPPVSHSNTYRSAYHPAYRVVDRSCLIAPIYQQMP